MSVQDRLTVARVARDATSQVGPQIASAKRVIAPTEWLFRTGEAKTCLYRVNSGAVCLYQQTGPQQTIIGFAFPGDLVGLGFLESHACCARAVTETEVTCLPLEALASAIGDDPEAQAKLNDDVEREFEFLRAALVEAGRSAPVERIAAFLVSLSRLNVHEGRDPTVVGELCSSGAAADWLGLSIGELSKLLLELEGRRLIRGHPSTGIQLKDICALERLAAGKIGGAVTSEAFV